MLHLIFAILHTSKCSRVARVIKHPLRGRCLPRVNVSHDADVSDPADTVWELKSLKHS